MDERWVRLLAHEVWLFRRVYGLPGDALSDWLRAERMLLDVERDLKGWCEAQLQTEGVCSVT